MGVRLSFMFGENMKSYEIASQIKPTERQLKWQDMEFYAIIYYGMNTFTGREIGDGFAVPETFCPENIDTDEWAQAVKDGAMNGIIITAKHYDGFCNWQTETTDYSVKSSNWLGGDGDLVKMVGASARKAGLKFGIYFPVWDRHENSFNTPEFNTYLTSQITELTKNYGELFEILIDDRCDEAITVDIDYGAIYNVIRENQPDCAITFRGPDGRWLGNSRAVTRLEEWSCVPANYSYDEDGSIPTSKRMKKQGQMETDIGSRKAIKKETEFRWAQCEVNYAMRPHWFHKKDDDMLAKTKDKILAMYNKTVGSNSNLMIGIAPDKSGHIYDQDKQILASTGHDLSVMYGYNLLKDGKVTASSELSGLYKASNTAAEDTSFWMPSENDKKPELIIEFDKPEMFDKVVIKENVRNGQHIEKFTVYITNEKGKWKKFSEGTAVGHKKICATKPVETDKVKIVFEKYRKTPEILYVQVN